MSRVKVNEITNKVATGPVDFPDGITGVALTATGNVTAGIGTFTTSIVVGSAVTANSDGIIVGGAVTATSFAGDGSSLTGVASTDNINTSTPASFVDINATGIVTAATFYPSVGWLGNRNVIINGGMLVAQRATSSGDGGMTVMDRFSTISSNTDELAFDQKQTDSYPNGFSKCYEVDVTTAESALAANELFYARYKVEAQDLRPFYNNDGTGKDFTLSFWVRAKQTGTYQVSIHKEDNTVRFISTTYTYAVADAWQFVEWNVTGDTGTSGINADNGQGFDISWKLAAGTDYTSGTPQTTWGSFSNAIFAAGHAVDVGDSTANYFRITGVQLELGSKATPFESRTYADELIRCQRYYFRFGGTQWSLVPGCMGIMASTTQVRATIQFPVTMRAVPASGGSGMYVDSETTASQNITAFDDTYLMTTGGQLRMTTDTFSAGGGTVVNVGLDHATTAYFDCDAEL